MIQKEHSNLNLSRSLLFHHEFILENPLQHTYLKEWLIFYLMKQILSPKHCLTILCLKSFLVWIQMVFQEDITDKTFMDEIWIDFIPIHMRLNNQQYGLWRIILFSTKMKSSFTLISMLMQQKEEHSCSQIILRINQSILTQFYFLDVLQWIQSILIFLSVTFQKKEWL